VKGPIILNCFLYKRQKSLIDKLSNPIRHYLLNRSLCTTSQVALGVRIVLRVLSTYLWSDELSQSRRQPSTLRANALFCFFLNFYFLRNFEQKRKANSTQIIAHNCEEGHPLALHLLLTMSLGQRSYSSGFLSSASPEEELESNDAFVIGDKPDGTSDDENDCVLGHEENVPVNFGPEVDAKKEPIRSYSGGFLPSALPDVEEERKSSFEIGDEQDKTNDEEFGLFLDNEEYAEVPVNFGLGVPKAIHRRVDDRQESSSIVSTDAESFESSRSELHPPPPPSSPTATATTLKKSALKTSSSYGNMELLGENIPICPSRKSWKVLPQPSSSMNMKRVESSASFFHQQLSTPASPPPDQQDTLSKSVSFSQIHIRDYDQTIGDNPSCAAGTPLSLDWDYIEKESLGLDQYEFNRPKRRSMRQMHLNYYQRKHILTLKGHTEEEIKIGKDQAKKIKQQRSMTRHMLPLMKIEDMAESVGRKARRALSGKGGSKGNESGMKKSTSTGLFNQRSRPLVLEDTSTRSNKTV
jgi:hypothetical protein